MNFKYLRQLGNQVQPYTLPDPGRRRRTIDFWLFLIGGVALTVGIALTCRLLFVDAHVEPKLALAPDAWHVSFENVSSNCDLNSEPNVGCLSHPKNPLLWESTVSRTSPTFVDRYTHNTGSEFWVGTRVAAADLKKAAKQSAQVLVLPRMNGLVQVWLDGVYQTTHDFSVERTPLMLNLPKSRLVEDRDLSIALAVFPYVHQPVPEKTRAHAPEGFFTTLDADRLTKSEVFAATGPHLIAVALFLLMSAILWSAAGASRTRDFAVGTQLSVMISLISLLSVDLSFRVLNVEAYERLYFLFLLIEAVLVVRLTWTMARNARETSKTELLSVMFALFAIYFLTPANWIEVRGVGLLAHLILPVVYLGCALLVAEQMLRLQRKNAIASRTRIEMLSTAVISLTLTAAAYFYESTGQSGFHVVWSRWLNIIMLLGLVRAFAKASATKASLIEQSPVSRFHKTEGSPRVIDGWVLDIEVLKFSSNRQVMSTVLSHLWTVSRLRDGEIIRASDRSLIVMIEKKADGSEDERLIETFEEMSKCVKDLEHRLPIMFSGSQYPTSVMFRASAARGTLTPDWQRSDSGIARLPIWRENEQKPALKTVRDLLSTDLDGALRSNDSSIVVMSAEDARYLTDRSLISNRARVDLGNNDKVVAFFTNRLARKSPAGSASVSL